MICSAGVLAMELWQPTRNVDFALELQRRSDAGWNLTSTRPIGFARTGLFESVLGGLLSLRRFAAPFFGHWRRRPTILFAATNQSRAPITTGGELRGARRSDHALARDCSGTRLWMFPRNLRVLVRIRSADATGKNSSTSDAWLFLNGERSYARLIAPSSNLRVSTQQAMNSTAMIRLETARPNVLTH